MCNPTSIAEGRATARLTTVAAVFCILFFAFSLPAAHALNVRLEGDRLWLHAEDVSLHELMRGFAHIGVRVKLDPELDGRVHAHIEDEDAERALSDLFEAVGYVFIWEVMDGPLGPWPKLAEMQVFRTGNRRDARPLFDETDTFRVMRMPDGSGIEYIADEIIIGFGPGSDQDAIRVLIRQLGGTVVESLPELGIYRIRLPPGTNIPALVDQLTRNPLVAAVEPNYAYRTPAPVRADEMSPAAAPISVRAPRDGAPPVAVLDSGLTMLPDMEGLVAGGFNALQPDQPITDTAGHGTQMALIASGLIPPGGTQTEGNGVPVLAIRAFNDDGITSNFAQMRSVFYAAQQGAKVLNMSWGSPANSAFLQHAITEAEREGLTVVASAGNEPLNQPMYPAAYADVIAVGAALPDGSPWPQSNYGDFIFVSAPGTARFPVGHQGEPGAYAGTSIASAYVSYALGLYAAQNPNATPAQIREALRKAIQTEDRAWDRQRGHGLLDRRALERLLQ